MIDFRSDERLRKEERLRQRSEFRHTQRGGRASSPHLVVYARANEHGWSRIGITVTRKVGPANIRNRWKRRLREIFRRNKAAHPSGYDFVVIVKHSAPEHPSIDDLRRELLDTMRRAADRSDERRK